MHTILLPAEYKMNFNKLVPSWYFFYDDHRWEGLKSEENFTEKRCVKELSSKSNSTPKVLTCDSLRVFKEGQDGWKGMEDKDGKKKKIMAEQEVVGYGKDPSLRGLNYFLSGKSFSFLLIMEPFLAMKFPSYFPFFPVSLD